MFIEEINIKFGDWSSLIKAICNAKGETIINYGRNEIHGRTHSPKRYEVVLGPETTKRDECFSRIIHPVTLLVVEQKSFILKSDYNSHPIKWTNSLLY